MTKAIGLLSGGLDSILAVELMLKQGIEVMLFNLITPFFSCTKNGCPHSATLIAKKIGVEIKVVVGAEDYIKIIKNPKHGYGKNMNPCIDCKIYMLKKASEYMEEVGASFLFTGEVLGQRPMSQRREAMMLIEKEAELEGLILRPLSSQFLPPTVPEKKGLIDREKLLGIEGRSRKPQMRLAEELGIRDYASPAGGCRLTDPQFAKRIREAFEYNEDSVQHIHLLRYGRHIRLDSGAKIIVGRNEEENGILSRLAEQNDLLMEVIGFGSPLTILKGTYKKKDIRTAASICARYSDCNSGMVKVRIECKGVAHTRLSEDCPNIWGG